MRVTHSTVASWSLEYSITGVYFDLHIVKQNLFSGFGRSKKSFPWELYTQTAEENKAAASFAQTFWVCFAVFLSA